MHIVNRLALALLLVVASIATGPGCALLADKAPAKTSTVRTAAVRLDEGRQTMLVATSLRDGGLFFTRPPYGLHGTWRAEVRVGVYDAKRYDEAVGALAGLEADLVQGSNVPSQFYGVYMRAFEVPTRGLQVFASSHGGNHGQVFFADATSVDLAIEVVGGSVQFSARDAAAGGAYQAVGSTPLASPALPHYPGFGFFNGAKGAQFAFTDFRVPSNGLPSAPQAPSQQALDHVYRAAFAVLAAVYDVDGPDADAAAVTSAIGHLDEALAALADARTAVEDLTDDLSGATKGPKTPRTLALAQIDAATKAVTSARAALQKRGTKAAKPFVNTATHRLFQAAWKLTDLLLPDDVRVTLPGKGI